MRNRGDRQPVFCLYYLYLTLLISRSYWTRGLEVAGSQSYVFIVFNPISLQFMQAMRHIGGKWPVCCNVIYSFYLTILVCRYKRLEHMYTQAYEYVLIFLNPVQIGVRRENYKLVWGNPSMLKKEESAFGKSNKKSQKQLLNKMQYIRVLALRAQYRS